MKYNTYYMDKYVNKSDKNIGLNLSLIHISEPTDAHESRMPSSA